MPWGKIVANIKPKIDALPRGPKQDDWLKMQKRLIPSINTRRKMLRMPSTRRKCLCKKWPKDLARMFLAAQESFLPRDQILSRFVSAKLPSGFDEPLFQPPLDQMQHAPINNPAHSSDAGAGTDLRSRCAFLVCMLSPLPRRSVRAYCFPHFAQPCQPSPIWQSGRPAHCPFRDAMGRSGKNSHP